MVINHQKEIDAVREAVQKDNIDIDEVIDKLHQHECSIAESIKFLVTEFGIKLGDAKNVVFTHPAWSEESEATNQLHNEIIESLTKAS
jgi:mannitol-1-phosphate/altronate dehydrogenase